MANMNDPEFSSFEDLPTVNNPNLAQDAYGRIMARHVLATLRQAAGKTLEEVAVRRGVTKAAIHQIENRPLAKVSVGSLVGYIQALGYEVDEDWIARAIVAALTSHDQAWGPAEDWSDWVTDTASSDA